MENNELEKVQYLKLKGCIAPTITIFNDDESINEEKTINHIDWLTGNGIQGIVVCGSTGESIAMTKDERKRVAELVIKEFKNKVSICIATGCYRTIDTIELSKHAQECGADSILIIPPYYMGVTKTQAYDHFKEVSGNVRIQTLLYNNPSASGILISPKEVSNYFEENIIDGVKLTIEDPAHVHAIRYLCKKDFSIFYGADLCAFEGLLCGAEGWISGIPNLIPQLSRSLCDAALSGNRDEAVKVWEKMLPLINFETYLDENREPHWLSLLKSGLEILGYDVGKPRKPIKPLNSKHKQILEEILLKLQ
ncbi:MAG: dihydrodipicolinate synthase family protein [Candidatus Humimicrobiaceae bacterium]